MPHLPFTRLDGNQFSENFEQGGFACPVGSNQHNPFGFFHFEVEVLIDHMISVSLFYSGQGGDPLTTSLWLGEAKRKGFGLRFGSGNPFHFLQLFNSSLCLGCFRCLGPEASDKILMVGNFPLLVPVGGKVLSCPLCSLGKESIVVSLIAMKLTMSNFQNSITDSVQKSPVVRDG